MPLIILALLLLGIVLVERAEAATYGTNFLTGGTPTASTYYATQYPSLAFDGNNATFWTASNNYPNSPYYDFPRWLKYDLGSGVQKKINKIGFLNGYTETKPDIQGSNDDTNWTTVSSTILTYTDNSTWEYRELPYSTTTYRYFRLYYSDTSKGQATTFGTNVAEVQAFECTDCDAPEASATTTLAESVFFAGTSLIWLIFLVIFAAGFLLVVNFYRERFTKIGKVK